MYINWSRKAADIKKDTGRQAEVTSLPQIKDTENPQDLANYQVLTVPKNSPNAAAAWNFITYLTGSQVQAKYLVKTGLASPQKSKVQDSTNYIDLQDNYATTWYNPAPAAVEEIFKQMIKQVLAGENPQTVIEGAAAKVTRLLGELTP
jgi:ABC-type glycerol-3-phosphate transport system substrate-binding protein